MRKRLLNRIFQATTTLAISLQALAFPGTTREEVGYWSREQFRISTDQIFSILRLGAEQPDAIPGVVMASPGAVVDHNNGEEQDYKFHWVRDGALTMRSLVQIYQKSQDVHEKIQIEKAMDDYVKLSKVHQTTAPNLGEPKFYLNGKPYEKDWGRPQNDGPALRASTLMQWADALIAEGEMGKARTVFESVIATDLQYTAKVHAEESFDVWEEVYGYHFFTQVLQASALEHGAKLAKQLGLQRLATTCATEFGKAQAHLKSYQSLQKRYILATQFGPNGQTAGHVKDKDSKLDVAALMGALYAQDFSGELSREFSVLNPWVLATADKLIETFSEIYDINKRGYPGHLIGRYSEDRYFGGNPWPIATLTVGQLFYRLADEMRSVDGLQVNSMNIGFLNRAVNETRMALLTESEFLPANTVRFTQLQQALMTYGDLMLSRVRFHSGASGELNEQFDRNTGELKALPDLTWSHAAMLEALLIRKNLLASCGEILGATH